MQLKKQSTVPELVELVTASHFKNRDLVRHYGNMSMQKAMNAQTPTVGRLSREFGEDKFIECLGRVFIGTSLYFDKPLNQDEAEAVAVEMLSDYEMSNLKLEDVVVITKEIKEMDAYGRLTANKILKHIKNYWQRRVQTAATESINGSQANKETSDMDNRIKKTIALPSYQQKRVDRTRTEINKYLK